MKNKMVSIEVKNDGTTSMWVGCQKVDYGIVELFEVPPGLEERWSRHDLRRGCPATRAALRRAACSPSVKTKCNVKLTWDVNELCVLYTSMEKIG